MIRGDDPGVMGKNISERLSSAPSPLQGEGWGEGGAVSGLNLKHWAETFFIQAAAERSEAGDAMSSHADSTPGFAFRGRSAAA